AKRPGSDFAIAIAASLLESSPAPPTTTIFSTPAARARWTTSATSTENSTPWICAWLSISRGGAPSGGMSLFALGLDAREQNRGRRDFMAGGEEAPPRLA